MRSGRRERFIVQRKPGITCWFPFLEVSVKTSTIHLLIAFGVSCLPVLVAAAPPAPPVKTGLWEVKMSQLDANGKEMLPPMNASMARMTPEARARMAEMMKGRGLVMPDENGAIKLCMSKESFDSGAWQQMAGDTGCTTNYSSTTGSTWKWHTSCPSLKTESDGETTFTGGVAYKTKVVSTSNSTGTPRTTTRLMDGKWLGADCGGVKPITPSTLGR